MDDLKTTYGAGRSWLRNVLAIFPVIINPYKPYKFMVFILHGINGLLYTTPIVIQMVQGYDGISKSRKAQKHNSKEVNKKWQI
jgi:hypothetical protein